jgi:hypothetical protein
MASHQKGEASKVQCQKEIPQGQKSKAGDDTISTNNVIKHLNLSDSIINCLTTEIMIGDSKAHKIAKRWLKNANEGTN